MDSIIFDLDGTLWDSTESIAKSWDKAVREQTPLNVTITKDTMTPLLGQILPDIVRAIFPEESEESREHLLKICCQQEHEDLLKKCAPLYEGLEDTLAKLSDKYQLFIVSNCEAGYIEVFLETSGLGDYFSGHLCPGDTGHAKAYNIRELIQRYHLRSPVYVGDTQGDCDATKEAGIPFVFAAYGLGFAENPDYTIYKLPELLDLF